MFGKLVQFGLPVLLMLMRALECKPNALNPVFLHGMERANTTFWWNLFREQPDVLAFSEPFNPELNGGARRRVRWNSRSLRHGFLKQDPHSEYHQLGIYPSFNDLITYERFIWDESTDMPEVRNFILKLIQAAQEQGKVPVFKLNRSFLRIPWFKKHFGGTHVYLHRDLGALVNSYYSFRGTIGYFLRKFATVIGLNSRDATFGEIAEHLGLPFEEVSNADEARRLYGRKISAPAKKSRQEMTDAIGFLWALGLSAGVKYAHLVVDNEALAEPCERERISSTIQELTGIKISLGKYKYKDGDHRALMSREMSPIIKRALRRQKLSCSSWLSVSSLSRPGFQQ